MSIEIREYIGSSMNITESTMTKRPVNLNENFNEIGPISKDSIIQFIEGIHVGPTRNFTWYTEEALESSVSTWTKPYQRPLIMHHNEKDGKTIGRILSVEYITRNTRSGTPALSFVCNVPDKDGKEQILDGRLKTVSIGVIAHDVRCSVCGDQIELDEYGSSVCGHDRGCEYEGETCYWMIYKMEAKELSYVIVPSDIYAHNLRVYEAIKKKKSEVKESVDNIFEDLIKSTQQIVDSIQESTETQEGTQVDEEVKKDAEVQAPETKEEPKADEPKEPTKDEDDKEKEQEEAPKSEEGEESESKDDNKEESKEEDENKEDEAKEDKEETEEDDKFKKELEDAKEEIAKLKKELKTLKTENEKLTNKVDNEKRLKESAEAKLVEYQAKEKKALVEQVNVLRATLNLPAEDEASLLESSEDTLKSTIKQLNEFTEVQKKVFGMQTLTSPAAVSEAKDNTSKENSKIQNVKESLEDSNNSIEDEYIKLFSNIF